MNDLGVVELLDADPRPTVVLDLNTNFRAGPSPFHFCNNALRDSAELINSLVGPDRSAVLFRAWMQGADSEAAKAGDAYAFGGQLWTAVTVRSRWRIVSGKAGASSQPFSDAKQREKQDALRQTQYLEKPVASNRMFSRFAEVAPVAMFMFNSQMDMQYCNDKFFEITGHPRVAFQNIDWRNIIVDEDMQRCEEAWRALLGNKIPACTEFRLQNIHKTTDDDEEIPSWVMSNSYPELNDDGSINTIMGTLYDISDLKWAESIQKRRVEEALESKRRQSNFQDIFAHEMRNPLGAVVQCADSTVTSLEEIAAVADSVLRSTQPGPNRQLQKAVESGLDAVRTIISCSMHQKRMFTDILTLSKFDSRLLLVTPVRVQPTVVVQDAIKIFELESQKVGVDFKFEQDDSLHDLDIDWVMLDPSRILQVLVNLFTNALKFAKHEAVRSVNVTLGADIQRPSQTGPWRGVSFVPSAKGVHDTVDRPEWGTGPKVHLWVTVRDTGCGMTAAEQTKLFLRFSQASPHTHVQHGGSGLGLFISKVLTELQGGQMGVSSEAGIGSMFAFFVQTRTSPSLLPAPTVSEPGKAGTSTADPDLKLLKRAVATQRPTILIVEDNAVNQKVLRAQLQKLGCNIHSASHGVEALDFLRKTKYWKGQAATGVELSLVLMDCEMPVMDGLTCARSIRELQRNGCISVHIPILAISANAKANQVEEARKAGMDDAIAKPFRIPELLPKLARLALQR